MVAAGVLTFIGFIHIFYKRRPSALNITHIARSNVATDVKQIVILPGWRNYFGGHEVDYLTCTERNYSCAYTYLKKSWFAQPDYESADMLVFHESDITQNPPKKYTNQLWAFRTGESQQNLPFSTEKWDHHFNYTVNFREDATIRAYSNLVKEAGKKGTRDFYAEKLKMTGQNSLLTSILWFVSNCHSFAPYKVTSGRLEYVRELKQWIDISVFTHSNWCSWKWWILSQILAKTSNQPDNMNNYTFYLAFENSLCKDYITEKFWSVINVNSLVIPVVLGGFDMSDYESIAPPNSYIHARNFTSPQKLAEHLKYVASNPAAFNYYHQWRNSHTLQSREYHTLPDMNAQSSGLLLATHERAQSVSNCVSVLEPS